jgi:hypothetical protein
MFTGLDKGMTLERDVNKLSFSIFHTMNIGTIMDVIEIFSSDFGYTKSEHFLFQISFIDVL